MGYLAHATIEFLQSHAGWAAPVVFALAFCESFAFVSLIVRATVILVGVGGLIGASGIEFWPVWLGSLRTYRGMVTSDFRGGSARY
jgi:membrane protein DedA with SNARE-associated domain